MKVGLITPQGWKMEYEGWDPAKAWANTVALAKQAEELGFGNGPKRTAGLAVKFADELNFVFRQPDWVAERMTQVRAMCEAAGRDPDTLRFSVYTLDQDYTKAGQARVDLIGRWAEIGVDRIVCFPTKFDPTLQAQAAFADDVKAAGIALDGA